MILGVFAGSFDPVHKGHIGIIKYLLKEHLIDKAMIIATGNYWNKQNLTSLEKRIDMLEFVKSERIIIDKTHNHYEYTYQILDKIEEEYKEDEICFIIGADNANTLYLWDKYDELIQRKIIIINRNNIPINLKTEKSIIIKEGFGDISSTKIRSNPEQYKEYLEEDVYNYIKENNLYKGYTRVRK